MDDQILQRAATLARQLADHRHADKFDATIRDHAQGICAGVDQGVGCYRERMARDYLAEHEQPVPAVDSELRDRVAAVIHDSDAWVHHRTSTGVRTTDFYAQLADEALAVVAPVLAARDLTIKAHEVNNAAIAKTHEEVLAERDLALWLHAEAVWKLERLRAETDPVRIGNLVYAVTGRWAGGEPIDAQVDNAVRVLRADETEIEELRAERDALKAKAVVIPETWRQSIGATLKIFKDQPWNLTVDAVGELLDNWRTGAVGQPDTEATKRQRSSYFAQPCDQCGTPTCEHWFTQGIPRTWREGDPEPSNVRRVRDRHGDIWTRNYGGSWESPDTMPCAWWYIAKKWAPLTEVILDGTQ